MSELYIYILNQNEIKKMSPSEILSMVSNEYQYIIGNNLCGIYVHGSIAFGCFNWDKSDIDFLVVVYEKLTQNQKELLISTLLRLNQVAPPKGFEMSVVLYQDCRDFKYPTPFQLHFSNAHLKRAVVPGFLRTLVLARRCDGVQFASRMVSPSRDMSR